MTRSCYICSLTNILHLFSGSAALSPDENLLLIDNLSTGTFNIYRFPASVPSLSFSLKSTRCFTKQCFFAEGGKVAICGSDHAQVHIMDTTTGEHLQALQSDVGEPTTNAEYTLLETDTILRSRYVPGGGCHSSRWWWISSRCRLKRCDD